MAGVFIFTSRKWKKTADYCDNRIMIAILASKARSTHCCSSTSASRLPSQQHQ